MLLRKTVYQNPQTKKLDSIVDKSKRVLVRVKTVFPFDLFPDTIIVDEEKVNIISGIFFFSQSVSGILIKNIKNVVVTSNLFFGNLEIQMSPLEINPPPITYLWKHDAYLLRRIIMGLVVCDREGIDISKRTASELLQKVEELGRSRAH